jgi:hypothetical protein
VADLAALDELCAWMRSNGATSARVGDVALTLGPPIASPVYSEQPSLPESPEDVERRDLETLLHSSGADVTPFLRRGQAA